MAVIKTKLTAYLGRALTLVQLSGLLEHCNSVHLRNPIMEMTKRRENHPSAEVNDNL